MRKGPLFFLFFYLVLASSPLLADRFIELRVSVTVPPRPCEYPNNCDPVPANTQTKVVVDNEMVSYVGSLPEVTKKDDLLTIIF
jgi:hypothetical protein